MVLRLVAYNKAVEEVSSKIGSFQGHLQTKKNQGHSLEQSFRYPFVCRNPGLFCFGKNRQQPRAQEETSLTTFTNVLPSSMVQTSQVVSPSMFPMATAVNPDSETVSSVEAVQPGGRAPKLELPIS